MHNIRLSFRLAVLSLLKKKESCIVLTLLAMLSVLFLDLGFSVNNTAHTLFMNKCEENNSAHLIIPCISTTYKTEYEDYIVSKGAPTEWEKENVAYFPTATNNCNELELGALLFNCDDERKIDPLKPIEEDTSISREQAIYVPIQLKSENVKIGEPYILMYKGNEFHFVVAGYFETTTFCNINSGFYKYFVHEEVFKELSQKVGSVTILSARFSGNAEELPVITEELRDHFLADTTYSEDQNNFLLNVLSYWMMEERTITFLYIGVAILFVISMMITAVTVSILVNSIREDVEKSTVDIGVLQAQGYTLQQMQNSFVMQYLILAFAGAVPGAILSYVSSIAVQGFLSGMSGFLWSSSVHILEDVISIGILCVIVVLVSILCVRRVRNLTPVVALQGRKETTARMKSFFPMQNGRMNLNLHLAVKNIFTHFKSNFVFGVIVAISAFTVGLSLVVLLNFAVNTDALVKTIGFELSDVKIEVSKGCDAFEFAEELGSIEGVDKTNIVGNGEYLRYENETVMTFVPEDVSKLEYIHPYKGEFPQLGNEIMISSELSNVSGKQAGDSIVFTVNDAPKEFLVSGLFSSTNGLVAYMTPDGIQQLYPDYEPNCIDVYLDDTMSTDDFAEVLQLNYQISKDNTSESIAEQKIAHLLADYGISSVYYSIWQDGKEILSGNSSRFSIKDVTYMKSFAYGQVESYTKYTSAIVIGIFITMIVVVTSVLRMTSKAEVLKNRKEFGILKSLGYTSQDIVKQLSLRFLISSLTGSLVGATLAMIGSPILFRYVFGLMGVTQVQVNGHPLELMLYCTVLCIILYIVTLMNGRSIRKISVYELLSE